MATEDYMPAVDIDKFLNKVRRQREAANATAAQIEMELVRFDGENAAIEFNVDWSEETVWATQRQMADLFGKDANTIGEHIGNLLSTGEFESAATTRKFRVVRLEGGRQVSRDIEHYNLDVILTVGYRVNGDKAASFRKWANGVLKSYLLKGYALNEPHLRENPQALRDLAAQVRALRSEEITIYQAVRDCFKVAASDYDKDSSHVRTFYATLQDKFLFAITEKTASQLILGRADARKPNMGVIGAKGMFPTLQEAKTGKSYLARDELYVLHILCEQFLLYAESKAIRGKSMTMADLAQKLDQLLTTHEYPVFEGYGRDYLKDRAMQHAKTEWDRLQVLIKSGEHLPAAAA
ncbi:hypothetical protein GGQ88_003507 [Novosphingobium hassiacum]|uniref:Virulence RhuM family protein n=1 Tax=Novosphingobium hassiacum TaxID=173676 RepID=A0A7W5ZZT8_9SPHN|nr:RhuM family protein [Novosphingobium hassiacum]MBB3862209.1 hypothetical protein [Novosphingobium hassiacum]